jgi:chorismate mutase/prephenate dehydratase
VDEAFDALYNTSEINIADEVYLEVRHCLLSTESAISRLSRIYSHQQAFAQCAQSLRRLASGSATQFERFSVSSTARGAQLAALEPGSGAIASAESAEALGLNVLRYDFQDRRPNITRFWIIGRGRGPQPTGNDRTLFLVELEEKPGSLARVLNLFAGAGVGLNYLHTRPIRGQAGPWGSHAFFLEFSGHVRDADLWLEYRVMRQLMGGIRAPRHLGSFPNRQ